MTWNDLRQKFGQFEFNPHKVWLAACSDIKAESYLDENVSDKQIQVAMTDVQYMIIEKVTGSCLMNQLKMLICDGSIKCGCAGKYRELLDVYLFPIISYGVQAELAAHLTYKERNQGVIRNNDTQHLQYPILNDIKYIKSQYEVKRDFYITRAVKWLKCNKDCFCELCACGCCDCETAPFQLPYSTPIEFETKFDNRTGFTRKI